MPLSANVHANVHASVLPETLAQSNTVTKILTPAEAAFLDRCRATMSKLVGDEFQCAQPDWCVDGTGLQLQIDGWSPRFKIAIDYVPAIYYAVPEHMNHIYADTNTYAYLLEYIRQTRAALYAANNILTIPLFGIINDPELDKYLLSKLHELTTHRCFIALPKPAAR